MGSRQTTYQRRQLLHGNRTLGPNYHMKNHSRTESLFCCHLNLQFHSETLYSVRQREILTSRTQKLTRTALSLSPPQLHYFVTKGKEVYTCTTGERDPGDEAIGQNFMVEFEVTTHRHATIVTVYTYITTHGYFKQSHVMQ